MIAKLPFSAKSAFALLSLSLITSLFYFAQHILIPLLLSLLFAILLRPLVIFLNLKCKLPHVLAVLLTVVLFLIFFAAILFFVFWQIADITDDWKSIQTNLQLHYQHLQVWVKQQFKLSFIKQNNYTSLLADKALKNNNELMGNTLSSFSDTLISATLIPIYTFLILLYRSLLIEFLYQLASPKHKEVLSSILSEIKKVVQKYIVGLLIQMSIIATLTSIGLLLFGIQYAILLGVITALFNLIPYVGILTAALLSMVITLGNSNDTSLIVGVIMVNVVVQLIDNNIIVPKVVGNHVSINALASIVVVIIGGALCGISGMFLSIPMLAIVKVFFDHIKDLKPWGYLLGNPPEIVQKNKLI